MARKNRNQIQRRGNRSNGGQVRQTIQVTQQTYQGPLPPPNALAMYDQISPGLANKIVAMAEREQSQRHTVEAADQAQEHRDANEDNALAHRGQWFSVFVAMLILGVAAFAIAKDQPTAAIASMTVLAASMATVFLGRKRRSHAESPPSDKA